jgi:hypothetical protein
LNKPAKEAGTSGKRLTRDAREATGYAMRAQTKRAEHFFAFARKTSMGKNRLTNEELIELLKVASSRQVESIRFEDVRKLQKAVPDLPSPYLYIRRFGSWSKACELAGLETHGRGRKPFTKEYLLSKMREAASLLGGVVTVSTIGQLSGFPNRKAYVRQFGSWSAACKTAGVPVLKGGQWRIYRNTGRKRNATLKDRFAVLHRDGFRCQYCGRSPQDGATLVIDHITPHCRGGKTVIDNLITSCFECNSGKRDVILKNHAGNKKRQVKSE